MALSEKNRFKKFKPNKDENRYATELSSSIPQSYAKRARFAKKCLKKLLAKRTSLLSRNYAKAMEYIFLPYASYFKKVNSSRAR